MIAWIRSLLMVVLVLTPALASETEPPEIKEINLDNGLRIMVLERSASPTFAAVYQFDVGGAMDPKGRSGIAHLLEHMMFKGTTGVGTLDPEKEAELMARLSQLWRLLQQETAKEHDPFREPDPAEVAALRKEIEEVSAEHKKIVIKNEYDELMTRAGAVSLNAGTTADSTSYMLQLPANRLELWFMMESDRLMNPVFREFYSERDVVVEERRQRYDNSPAGTVREALLSLMYSAHPYGTPVIGWPRDITSVVREDAEQYFKTYYSPSNCTMVLVGDVETAEVERLARKYFGPWKRQGMPQTVITAEPEQKGARRRVVEFDAEPRISIAWPTVPMGHPDSYPLTVLSRILGGLWSSRIDKTIVLTERIAARAGTSHDAMQYGGYFSAYGQPRGEHTTAEIEAAIEREIAKIRDEGVTEEELERAKISTEVSRVQSLKSNLGQAFRIARAVRVTGGTEYTKEYEKKINAVTAEQVRDVAGKYLVPARKNVVELVKNEAAAASGPSGAGVVHQRGDVPGMRGTKHSARFGSAMKVIRAAKPVRLTIPELGRDVDRVELTGGTVVYIKEDHSAPSVSMDLVWLGGSNTAAVSELAPFTLATSLLNEGGTERLDPVTLQDRLDELGMEFSFYLGSTEGGGSFWSLSRNFEESFDMALEMLMKPRLDPERLEVLKGQHIDRMRRRWDAPMYGAALTLHQVRNGDHPRLGYLASKREVEQITPGQIRKLWRRYLGSDNLYITVVGDFKKKEMVELIEKKLGSWRKAESKERKYISRDPVLKPGVYIVEKDIPQPAIMISHHLAVDRTAPIEDHAALEILNDILGGSGFRSRLMERLRSDEGLTYGIYSVVSHQGRKGVPGNITIRYQTKKESVAFSINSVMEEFARIITEQVSKPEVEEQIEAWRNRFIFRYTNDFYIVSRLMASELADRPYDYDRQMLDTVQKVTPAEVKRVAAKYLKPDKLTVAIFGKLTEEDSRTLDERFGLKILPKDKVFLGGYEENNGTKQQEGA